MVDYRLEGHYLHAGKKGDLFGLLDFSDDGRTFTGDIVDYLSVSHDQRVMGCVERDGAGTTLSFFKFPEHDFLANLLYVLKAEGRNLTTRFRGEWSALPYKLSLDGATGLVAARVDLSVVAAKGYAEASLAPNYLWQI